MSIPLPSSKKHRIYLIATIIPLLAITGWLMLFSGSFGEQATLVSSSDPQAQTESAKLPGPSASSRFLNLVQSLDPKFLPGEEITAASDPGRKRLVFIGDVHGCKDELEKLLDKISFNPDHGDHLIFTGDMINKGPDSIGVVELARKYGASSVRGNHEDRILLLRKKMTATGNTLPKVSYDNDFSAESRSAKENRDRQLARQLNDEQAEWLDRLPVILDVGQVPGLGQVVVVHAGLVPGVELEKQDPTSVMTMRTIDTNTLIPSPKHEGTPWSGVFNNEQSVLYSSLESAIPDPQSKTMCVIYGHDSATSLNIQTYTKGLDTGCYKGGKLTALVISDGGKQDLVQVDCHDYR